MYNLDEIQKAFVQQEIFTSQSLDRSFLLLATLETTSQDSGFKIDFGSVGHWKSKLHLFQ